jgi:hypothetical protein
VGHWLILVLLDILIGEMEMALMLLINWFKLLKVYNKKMLMFLFLLEDGILAVIMTYM